MWNRSNNSAKIIRSTDMKCLQALSKRSPLSLCVREALCPALSGTCSSVHTLSVKGHGLYSQMWFWILACLWTTWWLWTNYLTPLGFVFLKWKVRLIVYLSCTVAMRMKHDHASEVVRVVPSLIKFVIIVVIVIAIDNTWVCHFALCYSFIQEHLFLILSKCYLLESVLGHR